MINFESSWVNLVILSILTYLGLKLTIFKRKQLKSIEVKVPKIPVDKKGEFSKVTCTKVRNPKNPNNIICYDPSTLTYLGTLPAMSVENVENMIQNGKKAQILWAKTSFDARKTVLQAILKYIVSHQREICQIASYDSGKTNIDALLGEVLTTCEKIAYVCKHGQSVLSKDYRPTSMLSVHKTAYVEYLPLGVLGVIAPFNYPFHNVMNHIISGLFAGNAVVVKVSEYTSWSSDYFGDIVKNALESLGHSRDLVQIVTGYADAGEAIVRSRDVQKIIFTGSTKVGKLVMKAAADTIKPVILELGGKDPFVICDDVDIQGVMPMVMRGVFQNCGQNCCGIERIYVQEAIHDSFVQKALELVAQLRQGVAHHENIDLGAMAMPDQLNIIQDLVNDALQKGAKLEIGGKPNKDLQGLNYEPTILSNVTHEMKITQEEVFGPVMTIIKFKDDEDLMTKLNDCDYGLGSSVFSTDNARAMKIANSIQAGSTTINDFGTNYLVQALPFGGTKQSGFDRFAGPEGLRGCCLAKSVLVDKVSFCPTKIPKILQYPITSTSMDFGTSLITLNYGNTLTLKLRAIWDMLQAMISNKQ